MGRPRANTISSPLGESANDQIMSEEKFVICRGGAGVLPGGATDWAHRLLVPFFATRNKMERPSFDHAIFVPAPPVRSDPGGKL